MRSGNRLLMKLSWDESTETKPIERTLITARYTEETYYRDSKRIEWKNSIA